MTHGLVVEIGKSLSFLFYTEWINFFSFKENVCFTFITFYVESNEEVISTDIGILGFGIRILIIKNL